jgi:hypothetical protein
MKIALNFDELQPFASPKFPGGSTISDILNTFVSKYLFPLLGFLLLIWMVYAGYEWLISEGNPKSIANARNKIIWGIVGFLIIFSAYWIVMIMGEILGIPAIKDMF